MKTNIFQRAAFLILFALLAFSCQNKEDMIVDPKAEAPVVGELSLSNTTLVYGDSVTAKIEVADADALSHVEIKLMANNSVIYSKVIPGYNKRSLTLDETIRIPFDRLCSNQVAELVVSATNKNIKLTEKVFELTLERPVFEKLYLVAGEATEEIVLDLDASDPIRPYLYRASVDLPNNTEVFLYSKTGKQGMRWGFSSGTNTCDLASDSPISLCNSQSMDEKVKEITFDAFSFEITPLKKEMTVNDVAFLFYKKNPADKDYVKQTLRALNVPLVKDAEVNIDLIDLNEITFDPDYFEVNNDKLIYKGQSGNVTLYLNTLFNFVFVESSGNPLETSASYPEVLFVNGWGIGRPEMWSYNPDWSFDRAVIFRKVSDDNVQTVYTQTVIVSKWVQFKFYNKRDWGGEFSCSAITFEDNNFKALEEANKPGNYNLVSYLGDNASYKSAVAKITFIVPKTGNATRFKSVILAESDQD